MSCTLNVDSGAVLNDRFIDCLPSRLQLTGVASRQWLRCQSAARKRAAASANSSGNRKCAPWIKNYRRDFGVLDLGTLIEVKFVGEKTDVASIQEEILADLPGYLTAQSALGGTTWLPRGKPTRSPDVTA